MSEMRKNKLTQEWIIYAENRQKRPYEFEKNFVKKEKRNSPCPFCRGNECQTTPALYQDREQDWSIRVFPNRFPAVQYDKNQKVEKEAFYEAIPAFGRHEVVVDTPHHEQTIEQFSLEHLQYVISILQKRFIDISNTKGIQQTQIFKNAGVDAGMSIKHSHWQLVGLPIISKRQQTYQYSFSQYYKEHNRCILCDMIAWEKQQKTRVCCETEHFIAIAPYASRFSYELWILPKKHISSFALLEQCELNDFAFVLQKMLKRITQLREDISYNICFVEGGTQQMQQCHNSLHWSVQILPRIGGFAALEFATESYINSVLPETAAKWYRSEEK